jgi:hypothetical protein
MDTHIAQISLAGFMLVAIIAAITAAATDRGPSARR